MIKCTTGQKSYSSFGEYGISRGKEVSKWIKVGIHRRVIRSKEEVWDPARMSMR